MSTQHIVYKKVGDLEISLTIILPKNATNVPVLLYLHGEGGLLQGTRSVFAPHLLRSVEKYQHALVTADYRLVPQVGIEDIDEDVMDCIDFIRGSEGLAKQLENPGAIDTTRLAVCGNAAGGYLALIAGLYTQPKPKVIMAMYPITDPLGTFFCQDEVDSSHKIHAAAIRRFLDPNGPVVSNSQGTDRDNFYRWVVSEGNYAKLLGLELRFLQYGNYGNESWRISKQIPAYGLPPTYVCHGTKDVDVGVEQSDEVVGALVGAGIDVKYENMREMGHMFDVKGDLAMDAMYEFMLKYL